MSSSLSSITSSESGSCMNGNEDEFTTSESCLPSFIKHVVKVPSTRSGSTLVKVRNPKYSKNILLDKPKVKEAEVKSVIEMFSSLKSTGTLVIDLDHLASQNFVNNKANLYKFFRNVPLAKKLIINLGGNTLKDDAIYELVRLLSSSKKLESLQFNIGNNHQLTNSVLFFLCTYLKKLHKLRSLEINFSGNRKFTQEGISSFFNGLVGLKYIDSLSLNFTQILFPAKVFANLANSVRMLKNLQSFEIKFKNQYLRGPIGYPLLESLMQLPKLQHLAIDFPLILTNHQTGTAVFPHLKTLTMDLFNSGFSPIHLASSLKTVKSLKKLSCDLSQNALDSQAFKILFSGIQEMCDLESLELKLNGNKIENIDFTAFGNMPSLKTFTLSFGKKLKFHFDKNAQNLINNFKYLTNIEGFKVQIHDRLSEDCLRELLQNTKKLENLEEFALHAPSTTASGFVNQFLLEQKSQGIRKIECILQSCEIRL